MGSHPIGVHHTEGVYLLQLGEVDAVTHGPQDVVTECDGSLFLAQSSSRSVGETYCGHSETRAGWRL